jgi:hypothetical protein
MNTLTKQEKIEKIMHVCKTKQEKIEKMKFFCEVLNLTEEGDLERRKTIEKMWKEQKQIEKAMNYQQNEFSDDE